MMKKSTIIISLSILVSCFSSAAWAQGRAWKCSENYYTNDSQEAKKLGNCKEVGDGNVTIVNVGGSASSGSSGGYSNPPPVGGDYKPLNPGIPPAPKLDGGEQSGRNQDARKLLEVELQNEQGVLMKLQQEYNNGQPERLLSETNDEALYKVRVDRLSREIEVKVANIVAIQNEIARLK